MNVNVREETMEHIEIFKKPALFTNSRIDRDSVPEGWYCYDLRGSDFEPGHPSTLEDKVAVNHAGSVLSRWPHNNDDLNVPAFKAELDSGARGSFWIMSPDRA